MKLRLLKFFSILLCFRFRRICTSVCPGCSVSLRQMVRRLPRSEHRVARAGPRRSQPDDARADSHGA